MTKTTALFLAVWFIDCTSYDPNKNDTPLDFKPIETYLTEVVSDEYIRNDTNPYEQMESWIWPEVSSEGISQECVKDEDCPDLQAQCWYYGCIKGTCKLTKREPNTPCQGETKQCHKNICNEKGECISIPLEDGSNCEDGNLCTDTKCEGGKCVVVQNNCECLVDKDCQQFEDEDLCNGTLWCKDNKCEINPATVVKCEASTEPCKNSLCDTKTGKCILKSLSDGTPCNDGDPCTKDDKCVGGVCIGMKGECCEDKDCGEGHKCMNQKCCKPNCQEKCGGASDGCGGTCNNDCPSGMECKNGVCVSATPSCGNGKCEGNEFFCTCPSDCISTCGDGCCAETESFETCPSDCPVKCPSLSYSTYNLLYLPYGPFPGYSEQQIEWFIKNAKMQGSKFIRVMAIMDRLEKYGACDWVFGPWKHDAKCENGKCYATWNLNEWDPEYFKRLNFIVDKAKANNVEIIFSIFAIQENPLQYLPGYPQSIYDKLVTFIDKLKVEGFQSKISHWEVDNEGGTGIWTPSGEDDGSIYFLYTKMLSDKIRNTLGGTLYHSGEAPGTLANAYDIYMPHSAGTNPGLAGNCGGLWDSEGVEYLKNIKKSYGKAMIASSDGCHPNLCDEMSAKKFLKRVRELGFIGLEIDIGWFAWPENEKCKGFPVDANPCPSKGGWGWFDNIDFQIAKNLSQWMEDIFSGCQYSFGDPTPPEPEIKATLKPDEKLLCNQFLLSLDKRFKLIYQCDGNLVLYFVTQDKVLWSSKTDGTSPGYLIMQGDGNLVIYDSNGKVVWASNTDNHPQAYLVVQNDGNAVIYWNGKAIWETKTCCY